MSRGAGCTWSADCCLWRPASASCGAATRWARLAGIVVVGLSAVVNLGFLAAAPVWTTLVIALDLVTILALTVHGREIEER